MLSAILLLGGFVAPAFATNFLLLAQSDTQRARLRSGEVILSPATALGLKTDAPAAGAEAQHWVGAIFVPHATLAEAIPRLQNYDQRKRYMWPEIIESRLLSRQGDEFHVYLRLSEHSLISGMFDVRLNIVHRRLDATHLLIRSRSESIAEVPADKKDRGILKALNHEWRIAEADGGLYIECEAEVVSSRPPRFLEWMADPLIAQAARRTLTGTLQATRRIVENRPVVTSGGVASP
jgi:hypothetical protein